jgi:hypothetical protein
VIVYVVLVSDKVVVFADSESFNKLESVNGAVVCDMVSFCSAVMQVQAPLC